MHFLKAFFFLSCVVVLNTNGARILCFFYIPCRSHHIVFGHLYQELAKRGHDLVVITPNPLNNKSLTNLKEIDVSYVYDVPLSKEMMTTTDYVKFLTAAAAKPVVFEALVAIFDDDRVKAIYKSKTEKFDLIITEPYFPLTYIFGEIFKAPTISVFSLEAMIHIHAHHGSPVHPYLYADSMFQFHKPLNILDKLRHTYYIIFFKIFCEPSLYSQSEDMKIKYFGKDFPTLRQIEKNTASMVFVATNYFIHQIRPLPPSVLSIGFIHIKKENLITEDLQTILDSANKGVVYFSLGSSLRSSRLPNATLKVIIEALSELPYTVLWKWESDNVPNVGQNVVTRKWFPQQDILSHPNVKGFVTQGGLQSTEEAIIYGVPMVGIPFYCDQEVNIKKSEKLGIAIHLDKTTMTKDSLKRSIVEIMKNKQYHKKIKKLQKIAKDQPMAALERAVWWTEYVIRHKGARHLRSPAADISLFEYLLLDVILVVLSGLLLTSFIVYKVVRRSIRFAKSKLNFKVKTS